MPFRCHTFQYIVSHGYIWTDSSDFKVHQKYEKIFFINSGAILVLTLNIFVVSFNRFRWCKVVEFSIFLFLHMMN